MADVVTDGAFSNFAGYDCTLLLLEGAGITLEHGGGQVDVLSAPLQAARLRGDEQTTATLHDGSVRDFNVMVRRAQFVATVTSGGRGDAELQAEADVFLLYAVAGDMSVNGLVGGDLVLPAQHLYVQRTSEDVTTLCSGASFIATQLRRL
jgi:environmental stress-induced protein Ves